ncbi:MAG: ATP-binding protein [Methylococcaceae bacterium]|nr:ATP-binding protein [Methylococcaceae bacterium]
MTNTYQLKKIILIDSFWAGKTVLLDLDGHINLSGTNGAGKTTFLRLIQLFWGERPSNIVSSSSSKKGFIDYYLPRDSSYLVYEYQRPNIQTCHVMIQSDGRAAKYKFIDAPFDKSFYMNEHDIPRKSTEIDRLYRSTAETSRQMSVDDYCSVIQFHQVNSGKRWIRPLQNRFAMATSPITHIEKVISSVIEKIGDFDTIKQMLIDISRDKLSNTLLNSEEDKIPFQLNKQHIDAWLADLNASSELEAKQDDFDHLLMTASALKETLAELSHIHYFTRLHHTSTQNELNDTLKQLEFLKQQRRQLKQKHEQQLDPKEDEHRALNLKIKDCEFEIDSLEKQKLEYETQDAESFAFKGSLLDQIIQDQTINKNEIEALENESKEITQFYENQLTDLKHSFQNQQQGFENQCTSTQLSKEKRLTEAKDIFYQRKDQLLTDKNNRLIPIEEKKSQLHTAFGITKASLNSITPSKTLAQQFSQNQHALKTVREQFKQLFQTHKSAQNDYNSALNNYQSIETQLKNIKVELVKTEDLHNQCLKRLRPELGSLQHYLEHQVNDWEQNIGRVIAPELLESTSLNPQAIESNDLHFYGLEIDLESLAERDNQTSNKASLEQQEQDLFSGKENLTREIEQIEASLVSANKLREHNKTELNRAEQALESSNQKENNLLTEEESLNLQIEAEKQNKRQEIENNINHISQQIESCQINIEIINKEYETEISKLKTEHLGREGTIVSDAENTIVAITQQIESICYSFKQEQQRIKQQLTTDLKASGADDTIVNLNQKLKELKTQEIQARSFQDKDKTYQIWLAKRWKQNPVLCQQRSDYQQQSSLLNALIEQIKTEYKNTRTKLNQDITNQEGLQEKHQSLLTRLGNTLELLNANPPILSENIPEYAASTLPNLSHTVLQKRKQQEQTLHHGKQILIKLFNKHHRSQLAEAWQKAMDQARTNSSSNYFQTDALDIEQPLKNILQMLENVKQATNQQIQLHATDVNAFYSHLCQFERIIKQTGNTLSTYVSEKQYFDALGDIKINIRSKMNDLEYWQALKTFGENYQQYCDQRDLTGEMEIPNSLIEAMGELTSLLPPTGINIKHISLFDIEFSITENGQVKLARNAKELKDVSSTGLSYLALITFFTGVTSMLRKKNATVICWPIDELGDLAPENIEAMMNMLQQQNIHIFSATPTADRQVLSLFKRRYHLDKQKLHEVHLPESKLEQMLNQLNTEEYSHV